LSYPKYLLFSLSVLHPTSTDFFFLSTGKWDAVVTCFFLDTAQNIVEYLRTIYETLKDDGIWINLGPTLWHYESSSNPKDLSIELDVLEIKELSKKIGFQFELNSVRPLFSFFRFP
jgi:hypothetical protein